ncbi:MAG: hypothetical protein N3B21_00325 [Clostridia bacterium]|nr:hypothetical protein [Clostridia bacterium]
MNENLSEFLFKVFAIFFFLIAVSMFVVMNNKSTQTLSIVKEGVYEDKAVYRSNFSYDDYTATGAEIISKIYDGLDVNIVVDGSTILKDVDVNTFNFNSIEKNAVFKIAYTINDGTITGVTYTKR